jgi:hypothetical protein
MMSLLNGVKRGCFQVAEEVVHGTMLKHQASLSKTKEPETWADLIDEELESRDMGSYIKRIVHTMFPKPFDDYNLYEASTSASLSHSRAKGGAYESILEFLGFRELGSHLVLGEMLESAPGHVDSHYQRELPSFDSVISRVFRDYRLSPLKSILPKNFEPGSDFGSGFVRDYFNEPLEDTEGELDLPELSSGVSISPVLEPLKVRLVSKGEPVKYWLSRAYQKFMWQGLQRIPAFRLTGRPLLAADLFDVAVEQEGVWVSGDYSAATDSVRMSWTVTAFEAILDQTKCSEAYSRLLRRVLYGQWLKYPVVKGFSPIPTADQQSGQLMGSTLSFPILCILNLAAFWRTYEQFHGRTPIRKLPVFVNGDDILFQVPKEGVNSAFYKAWLVNIRMIGFELSLGKNYVHPEFLMINSEAYCYRHGTLTKVPFLNCGLLVGQAKVSRVAGGQISNPADRYRAVLEGSCDPLRPGYSEDR